MANADGSVIIKADIDDKQAQKELNALEKKIEALQEKITNKKSARNTLFNQANNLGAQLDEAKAKLAQMKGGGEFFTSDAIKQQEAAVASMEKEWNAMNDKLDKQNASIREGEAELDRMKAKAGELGKQLGNTGKNAGKIQEGLDKASQGMEAFTKRVKMLAKRALVFTIIARALAALRDWLADVVSVNGEARSAIAQLKGALLTLAQPLVQIIIPAFTALVKVLATVVSFIANIVSALFGTTAKESANAAKSLNDQMNAYKGVGGAAKSASKQLASFDEINRLSSESSGGASAILPNFSQIGKMDFLDEITDRLKKIGQDIANIFRDVKSFIGSVFSGDWGAALDSIIDFVNHARELLADLLDAVSDIFGDIIDTIIEKCGLAGTPVGNMMAGIKDIVQGGLGFISGLLTGDLEKMKESVIQMFTGVKTFVSGIWDWFKLGLTSLLDWLDEKTNGRFHEIIELAKTYVNDVVEGAKEIFGGLIDFLTGVFTLDWEKAWEGIKEIFRGIWNTIVGGLEAAVNLIIKGINWLISKLNSLLENSLLAKGLDFIGVEFHGIPQIQGVHIPRLAQGAVIPPNRKFMAVLGDQNSGTNIEAPADLIRQIVREEINDFGGGEDITIKFTGDLAQLARVLSPEITRQQRNRQRALGV